MATLPETLAARLAGSIRKGADVVAMSRNSDAWRLALATGDSIDADAVICAAPAYAAARIIADARADGGEDARRDRLRVGGDGQPHLS